jgi:prepilin-type N-terminal cleavage/methylation domain-containing protein
MKKLKIVERGFTLIELLIVIALLGALAIGLLAAIDPFEQLKKGRDTGIRNSVEEFYNSSLRYYSLKSAFPWAGTALDGTSLASPEGTASILAIVDAGELKTQFLELVGTANLNRMFLSSNGTDNEIVCFQPESKSFRSDNNTKYDSSGNTIANCPNGTSTLCHWCIL